MTTRTRAACCHTAAIALVIGLSARTGSAQQTPANPQAPSLSDYFNHGADATSIPGPGQPGHELYTNGSQLYTIPQSGPAAAYFSNGAQATSIPSDSPYFQSGAQATSVPADSPYFQNGAQATTIPAPGQPGSEYFQQGAQATSVPAPGQPGYEYFARGSEVMSLRPSQRTQLVPAPQMPAEPQTQPGEPPAEAQEARPQAEPEGEQKPSEAAPDQKGAQAPEATSGEPASAINPSSIASGPAGTETTITPATTRARENANAHDVAAPAPGSSVAPAAVATPQGHYASALDRMFDMYAVLFVVGAASLLLLLAAVGALGWRARMRAAHGGRRSA